jgi:hypothetical protein
LYYVAPPVAVLGQTVFAIRFPMALLAGLWDFDVRRSVHVRPATAVLAAASVRKRHVHFSRMAFPVIRGVGGAHRARVLLLARTERRLYHGLTGIV